MSPIIEQDSQFEQLFSNTILHDLIVPKRDIHVELLQKIVDRKTDNLKICVFIDEFRVSEESVYITQSESTVLQRKTCWYHPNHLFSVFFCY